MNKQDSDCPDFDHGITRRKFIGAAAGGSAALLTGGLTSLLKPTVSAAGFDFIEATVPQLQAAMASGALTSAGLTMGYINRIQSLNPPLHAVIEVNPNAVAIATALDNERRAGNVRGPLHGIPLLVKDNIATKDNMQTTAGSLAIYGSQVPADAPLIQKLRAAGAIILGKANLGEWANFRDDEAETYPLAVGWSARGGSTNNAYDLSYTSWGSSSGSGAGRSSESVRSGGWHRNGRFHHRPVSGGKHFWFEADARVDFAGRNRSDQSSARHCRADGAFGHRRRDSARHHAIAANRLHATSSARCVERKANRARRSLFRLQLLRQRHPRR